MWPRKRHALIGKLGQGSVQACVHCATGANSSVDCLGLSQKIESRGSTPEPPKFPLPQFQSGNQCIFQ